MNDLLVLSAHTVPTATWLDRLDAAVAGGFGAVGVRLADVRAAREAGLSDADLRASLADRGLVVSEVDVLWEWGLGGERGDRSRRAEAKLLDAAEAVSARSLNAVTEIDDPVDVVAGRFAALCDRAAEHGLAVHIEFLPWSSLPDLATAWAIVQAADRPNGGLMVDTWHHYRGPGDDALLATIPPGHILGVQLDDAPAAAGPDPQEETLHRRMLPGQGELDLVGFVRTLDAMGVHCPIGVEMFSDEIHAMPPRQAAEVSGRALRELLDLARSS